MDMRNNNNLIINKAILHILNNKEEVISLNEFLLELTPKTTKLFENHIKNSINDEGTRIAKFKNKINVIRQHCENILDYNDDENFIKSSQEIACQLYDSMKKRNISSTNFVVCLYTTDEGSFIALLKMDFSDVIETEIKDIHGKLKIALIIKEQGVPSDKQKLQKCVFVKKYVEEDVYDIILLDKQAKQANKDELVANFFIEDFLHSELAKTDKDLIRSFKRETEQFFESSYCSNIDRLEETKNLLVSTLRTTEIMDVNAFSNTIFGTDEKLKEDYKSIISEKIGDFSFNIDKEWVGNHLKKKVYKTNTGVKIDIDVDTAEDPNSFEIINNDNNTYNIIIKNVEKYTQRVI